MRARASTISPAPEASRTGEWREGIGKLLGGAACAAPRAICSRPISTRSRRSIRRCSSRSIPARPRWRSAGCAPQDRLIACEREPTAARALAGTHARRQSRQGGRDRRLHGAQRLCAAEGTARPGADRSAVRAAGRVRPPRAGACRRAPQMADRHLCCSGTRSRTRARREAFARRLARLGIPRILRAELTLPATAEERLRGSGLVLVNPPWRWKANLACCCPALAASARRRGPRARNADRLAGRRKVRCGGAPLSSAFRLMSTLACWL